MRLSGLIAAPDGSSVVRAQMTSAVAMARSSAADWLRCCLSTVAPRCSAARRPRTQDPGCPIHVLPLAIPRPSERAEPPGDGVGAVTQAMPSP